LTLPTFVALGTGAGGTGDVVPGLPAGHTTSDLLLLAVESAAEAVATPTGYTIVPGFPIDNLAVTTRLSLFYKYDGGSETDPTVVDPGDHAYARIAAFRGVSSLDPFHAIAVGPNAVATTNGTLPSLRTTIDDCLIVQIINWAVDDAGPIASGETNASLGSLTEQGDEGTVSNNGGGLVWYTGTMATRGNVAVTTCTLTSTSFCGCTIALAPTNTPIVIYQPPIGSHYIRGVRC
jgi:hypothetical protein